MKRVNIIGFGLIGKERAKSISLLQKQGLDVQLGLILDPFLPKNDRPQEMYGLKLSYVETLEEMIADPSDLVVISCPHHVVVHYACELLKAKKVVLVEKPMGRNLEESLQIISAAPNPKKFFVGFNYRFMPGIRTILTDISQGLFGKMVSLSIQLGHGGKPGDEKTWKLDPDQCGGGVLLDPGIHLLDLILLISREAPHILSGTKWSGFWKTGIEEEAHFLLKSGQTIINLQMSVVRWRSTFSIQANGSDGYGIVTGRGRSYGEQRYVRGRRWGWQKGVSQAESEELVVTSDCESSFAEELKSILGFSNDSFVQAATADEALVSIRFYEELRRAAKL